ncbi:hypothetical protein GCM10027567_08900 [Spongiibacter taiwanensis]
MLPARRGSALGGQHQGLDAENNIHYADQAKGANHHARNGQAQAPHRNDIAEIM